YAARVPPPTSEAQLETELDDARIARAGHATKRSGPKGRIDAIKAGMVENVKELRPELQVHRYGDAVVLEEGHVPLVGSRFADDVASGVVEETRRRFSKGRRVEPLLDGPGSLNLADQIEPGGQAVLTGGDARRGRQPAGHGCDARDLPAADLKPGGFQAH